MGKAPPLPIHRLLDIHTGVLSGVHYSNIVYYHDAGVYVYLSFQLQIIRPCILCANRIRWDSLGRHALIRSLKIPVQGFYQGADFALPMVKSQFQHY